MTMGTAIITGASSGIGAVYADRFARRGYGLVLVARDRGRLVALAERLATEHGVAAIPWPADLTRADDREQVLTMLRDDDGLSLLVNCAGIGPKAPLLGSGRDGLESMLHLNVDVLHNLTVTAAQAFAKRRRGAIINIASVVALMPERFNATYCASKAFVLAFTQAISAELKPHGVQVQAVLPGFTRTELFERAGVDIAVIPPEMIMEAGDMVDAALVGFDRGEIVTIPSLADVQLWSDLENARLALAPYLSLKQPAARYTV
ncbi:SDR family oxidoreductase [Azospirillum sp. HJ39]|uniref:SDR family NAD(P)-dependent oxidoreductase n=1 Tax=Azospirillum sp. HJ39 TaxID=3159496 RepID=UPI0035580764